VNIFIEKILRSYRHYICLMKDPKLHTAGNVLKAFCHRSLQRIDWSTSAVCDPRDSCIRQI